MSNFRIRRRIVITFTSALIIALLGVAKAQMYPMCNTTLESGCLASDCSNNNCPNFCGQDDNPGANTASYCSFAPRQISRCYGGSVNNCGNDRLISCTTSNYSSKVLGGGCSTFQCLTVFHINGCANP